MADARLTVGSWAKGLVEELMSLTHSQWIYRNVSKHHTTRGLSQQEAERHLDAEIERHRSIGFGTLPPESHYLLEIPHKEVEALTRSGKQYWLLAAEAARTAGEEALRISQGESASWEMVGRDARASGVPTHTPYVDGAEFNEATDSATKRVTQRSRREARRNRLTKWCRRSRQLREPRGRGR